MTCNYKLIRNAALSLVVAGGMAGFATLAHAQSYNWQSEVSDAQQQLKNDGYYTGNIDGIDGPMTMAAIRNYQHDNQLAINGRLDRQTRDSLGIAFSGEANREVTAPSYTGVIPSQATVKAAQHKLEQSGFYSGNIDGMYGPETRAAVREFQQNSQLSPTGQLNQETLAKLGVSK
jgi:peptidoglycan hydrolase-like protein with peptidoglycan-binding domain